MANLVPQVPTATYFITTAPAPHLKWFMVFFFYRDSGLRSLLLLKELEHLDANLLAYFNPAATHVQAIPLPKLKVAYSCFLSKIRHPTNQNQCYRP